MLAEGVNKDLERIRRLKLKDVLRRSDKVGGEKMRRVVIPVADYGEVDSQLSEHFGRAPFFAVFELSDDGRILDQKMVPNESEHFGGVGFPPDRILQLDPDAVVTYGMGPRALSRFQYARVAVLRANSSKVRDVLSAYTRDELQELTEGCHHARRQS